MPKILITDDSPTIRKMVISALSSIPDSEFLEAENGLESIESITLNNPELVILDINMPDMNGIEVIQFIRQHPGINQLPIVVLTTRSDPEFKAEIENLRVTSYLPKPFQPNVLRDIVMKILK